MRWIVTALIALFLGCAPKEFTKSESLLLTLKTKLLRFSDIAYLFEREDAVRLDLYSAGVPVMKIEIARFVCIENRGCMSKSGFNERYLSAAYPDDLLLHILKGERIFNGRAYEELCNGYAQIIRDERFDIRYRVKPGFITFKDKKNKILIKIRKI